MAETVNMQQSEYDGILSKLTALHETQLQEMRNIAVCFQNLCEASGGFYVEKISEKVNLLMEEFESQILSGAEKGFQASEMAMNKYMSSIKNIDTAC